MLSGFLFFNFSFSAFAATITVDTLNDTGGAGDCELRDAINSANSNSAVDNCTAGEAAPIVDRIDFSVTGNIPLNGTALPTVTEAVNIDGDNDDDNNPDITIDAGNSSRVFDVNSEGVIVQGFDFLNGAATGDNGGTFHVNTAADLTLLNSTIDNSTADLGGAIYVESDAGQVTLDGVDISNTTANEGGSIYLNDETVNVDPEVIDLSIDHTTITNSTATTGHGGGIHIGKNNEAQIRHTTITGAQAAQNGGGIYDEGEDAEPPSNTQDLNLDEVNIYGSIADTAAGNFGGGAIYLGPGAEVVSEGFMDIDTGNTAFNGGGIFVGNGTSLTLSPGDKIRNSTAEHGGGIYVDTGGFLQVGGLLGLEPEISFNQGTTSGGGIEMAPGPSTVIINHGIVQNNSTFENGGGIFVHDTNTLVINDSLINSNSAPLGSGGGIYTSDDYLPGMEKNLNFTNVTFSGNSAGSYGGAIFAGNRTVMDFDQIDNGITGNSASIEGGFLVMGTTGLDSTIELTNSDISGNNGGGCPAAVVGGAYNPLLPPIQISTTTFNNNTATASNGGALCLNVGSMTLNDVDFTSNTTPGVGGALFLNDNGTDSSVDILNGSDFHQNVAGTGGAIYASENANQLDVDINGSTFDLTGGGFINQGGAIYNQDANIDIDNATFISDSAVTGNYAGAILNSAGQITLTASSIANFAVSTDGGAIYTANGTFTIDNSTITNNLAGNRGGAIYGKSPANYVGIINSYLGQNAATLEGGAIYQEEGDLNIENSTIDNNASASGAGIFVYDSAGTTTIDSNTITNNNASVEGGGLIIKSTVIGLINSIVAGNTAPTGADCSISIASPNLSNQGHNLYGVSTGCGTVFDPTDLIDVAANLGTLALHGGTTLNYDLLANSPAINAGSTVLVSDQRNISRPQGGTDDIGSYEFQDATPPIISEVTPVTTPTLDNTPDYTFTSNEAGSITYGGGCSSATTNAVIGNLTITFNTLAPGTYALCTITVTDVFGNISNLLNVTSFTIDTPPTPPSSGGGGSAAFGQPASSGNDAPVTPTQPTAPTEPVTPTEPTTTPTEPAAPPATPATPTTPATAPANSNQTTPASSTPNTSSTTDSSTETTSDSSDTNGTSSDSSNSNSTSTSGAVFTPTNYLQFSPSTHSVSCDAGSFEIKYNLNVSTSSDFDGDGLSDALECQFATNPTAADTDQDGKSDGFEALNLNTNPVQPDQFNPLTINRDFVIVTLPENSLVTADDSPLFLGLARPIKSVKVFIFDGSVVDQGEMSDTEFDNYLAEILQKFLTNKLDASNPEEAKFIGKITSIGSSSTDQNGLFTLDSSLSLRDNKYYAIGQAGASLSKPVDFTVDSSLQYISPTVESLSGQTLTDQNLKGDASVQLNSTDIKPVLTGKIAVPSKIVAIWQSNISSSALLADALDQDFRLSPPTNLEPGNHSVILTAYRSSDNAQSKSVRINFTIPAASSTTANANLILLGTAGLLDLVLLILVIRRRKKTAIVSETNPPGNVRPE